MCRCLQTECMHVRRGGGIHDWDGKTGCGFASECLLVYSFTHVCNIAYWVEGNALIRSITGGCISYAMLSYMCHQHAYTLKSSLCARTVSSRDASPAVHHPLKCAHLCVNMYACAYKYTVCVCVWLCRCLCACLLSVYASQHVCIVFVYVCSTQRGHKSSGILQAHPEGEG